MTIVRDIQLRRRRSRVPWIYLVYQARASRRGRQGAKANYSFCRRRKAGTSSGDTGSNSAPGLNVSVAGSAAAAAIGISSTGRLDTVSREPPPPDAAIFSGTWKLA